MVMCIQPIADCIDKLKSKRKYDAIIYMTPDGRAFKSSPKPIITQLLESNYTLRTLQGVDQRVRDHYITQEISIGDYVLTGGELAAAVFCDSIIRLIPGVISNETSALSDSFQDNLPLQFTQGLQNIINGRYLKFCYQATSKKLKNGDMTKLLNLQKIKRPDILD